MPQGPPHPRGRLNSSARKSIAMLCNALAMLWCAVLSSAMDSGVARQVRHCAALSPQAPARCPLLVKLMVARMMSCGDSCICSMFGSCICSMFGSQFGCICSMFGSCGDSCTSQTLNIYNQIPQAVGGHSLLAIRSAADRVRVLTSFLVDSGVHEQALPRIVDKFALL